MTLCESTVFYLWGTACTYMTLSEKNTRTGVEDGVALESLLRWLIISVENWISHHISHIEKRARSAQRTPAWEGQVQMSLPMEFSEHSKE